MSTVVDSRTAVAAGVNAVPRPRLDVARLIGTLVVLALLGFGIWSLAGVGFSADNLTQSLDTATRVLSHMGPISVPKPADLLFLIGQTLGIVMLGTLLAAVLSVPVAIASASNTTPAPWLRMPARVIGVICRAVPDVVLALAFALAFKLGSAIPGILAIGIHSVGMISKLFADAIEQVDRGPELALRATGATRAQQFWSGTFPQVLPSWIATFLHRFDINLRGSAILGYAGVGGLGYAMRLAFADFPEGYGRGLGLAGVIFALCIVVELISSTIRKRLMGLVPERTRRLRRAQRTATAEPVAAPTVAAALRRPWNAERIRGWGWGVLVVVLLVGSWICADIHPSDLSWPELGAVLQSFWPANFGTHTFGEFLDALLLTVQMAAAATILALLASLIIGPLAARGVSPSPLTRTVFRVLLVVFRGVPELVLAIFLIMVTGLGQQAGVLALGFGGVGLLGKLIADGLEEVPAGPQRALSAVGATRVQQFAAATWPMGLPSVIGNSLYLFDGNVRAATLLGIVGAGGVGFYLTTASPVLAMHGEVTTLVGMVIVTVVAIEALSAWLRRVFS